MKTAHEKGFSPLVIIIVGIVVFILIVLLINAWVSYTSIQSKTAASLSNNQLSNQQTTQASTQNNQKLAEVESDAYIFYYPENYVEMTAEGKDTLGYTLAYHNPNSKSPFSDNIFLKIKKQNKKLGVLNFKQCEELAENNRQSTNEKIEVSVVNNPLENGCEITSTDEYNLVTKQKLVWSKDPNDLNVYTVKGVYDADDSKDQGGWINLAITAFMLKP